MKTSNFICARSFYPSFSTSVLVYITKSCLIPMQLSLKKIVYRVQPVLTVYQDVTLQPNVKLATTVLRKSVSLLEI